MVIVKASAYQVVSMNVPEDAPLFARGLALKNALLLVIKRVSQHVKDFVQ